MHISTLKLLAAGGLGSESRLTSHHDSLLQNISFALANESHPTESESAAIQSLDTVREKKVEIRLPRGKQTSSEVPFSPAAGGVKG